MNSPFTVPIIRATRDAIRNNFLVGLKDNVDMASHMNWLRQQRFNSDDGSAKCEVIHEFKLINGYCAILIGPVLEELAKRDDVESITEDVQIRVPETFGDLVVQD